MTLKFNTFNNILCEPAQARHGYVHLRRDNRTTIVVPYVPIQILLLFLHKNEISYRT